MYLPPIVFIYSVNSGKVLFPHNSQINVLILQAILAAHYLKMKMNVYVHPFSLGYGCSNDAVLDRKGTCNSEHKWVGAFYVVQSFLSKGRNDIKNEIICK